VSYDNPAVELPLSPVRPATRQLVTGLERPDVSLANASSLGIQGSHYLRSVSPVAGSMRHSGFRAAETMRRTFRIMALVPGVADQDELATEVARGKFGGAAAAS
jgi:hypothetical protein